jgi:integrase
MENGWLKTDPFAKLKLSLEETDPVFLSAHELELVAGKKIENERLAIIRDIFLFCCMTSLCFIDVKNLKRSEVTIGIDGLLWIDKKRQKSKMPCRVPLLPLSMQILDKYKDYLYCINEDKLLPVCSNTKFNNYLKELAAICGINKNLTTHTARHAFGTSVTLANGVPMATVRSTMGHATDEQTRHYAKVLPEKESSDMKRLKRVFKSKGYLENYEKK